MSFHQRRPAPPLDAFVESVWLCRAAPRPPALERVIPGGGAQVIVNLREDETRTYADSPSGLICQRTSGSVVSGIATRYQIIDTDEQEHVAGIAFRPGGTYPFLAAPAHDLSDRDVPLDELWGRACVSRLREALLEAATPEAALHVLEAALLEAWLDRVPHRTTVFALASFRANPSVARVGVVADRLGVSARQFIERFTAEVGITPKRYCRLLRFQQAVTRAHHEQAVDWPGLALACGYVDQAHLIHEFRAFSGLTPTRYVAGRTVFQNHVTFLQSGTD